MPKLQVVFEISSFEFFVGLVIYKGNLLNPIEWGFDRKKIEKYAFFESKNLERKKKFFSKQKKMVTAGD